MASETWFFVRNGNLYRHTENDGWSAKKGLDPVDVYIGPLTKIFEGIDSSIERLEYQLNKQKREQQ